MGASSLVGRDAEIALLDKALADAAEHGGALLVTGAAGIGKTSVMDAATSDARGRGCTVLAVTGFREGEKRVKGDRQGSIRCLPCSDNRIDRLSSGVAVDCAGAPTIEAVRLVR